jgi:hypothetical protein
MKQTAKKGVVVQRLLDKSIGVRIRSKENGGGVAITVTQATKVRLTSTTGGNDDYTWGVAGIDTVGALVDAINADGMFEAVVIDALRSENPDDFFIDGAAVTTTDENGVVCYDLLVDNSVALTWAVCLSPLKPNFDMPAGHRVHLQQVDYDVDNTTSTNTLKIYRRSKSGTETLIYSATNADGSDTSLTWASGEGYISGSIDEDLVVFFDGTVVDANSTYIRLIGIYE